jgi:hypothetical protein
MLFPEGRWSAWRVQIESMALWHALVVIAALRNISDFDRPLNFFLLGEVVGLAGFGAIYFFMSRRRSQLWAA